MRHRTYRGRIVYLGDEVGERGRESFTVTVHGDGNRTIRAQCEMDDSEVLRDVVHTVDERWRPLESYVRLSVQDRFFGAGWFRFGDGFAECEADTVDLGRISQRLMTPGHPPSFGPHPVACDVWHLGAVQRGDDPPAQQRLDGILMSSPLPNGASGPMLSRFAMTVRHHGRETITVPAGTFDCDHWSYALEGDPDEHLWVHGDDLVLVRIRWDRLATTYELAELTPG